MPPKPLEYIYPGVIAAQAIHTAVRLGIPDHLVSGPRSASELAIDCDAHAPSLERLLRALISIGVFQRTSDGKYQNSSFSEILRKEHPQSLRGEALFLPAPYIWQSLGSLSESVQEGKPAFDRVFGKNFFSFLAEHPGEAETFNRVMSQEILWTTPSVLRAYDFSQFKKLVDIGGGTGQFLSHVLKAAPSVEGILFDQPQVVARAAKLFQGELAQRLTIVGGSFFDLVPEGGDAYVLRRVIHDWEDEEALKILSNIRSAISASSKLLIIEGLIDSPTNPVGLMDIMMLVLGGRERTQDEFRKLVRAARFTLNRVFPAGTYSLLECVAN